MATPQRKRKRTISIGGRAFELGRLLGTGGTSEVFSAREVDGGQVVAFKVLHPSMCEDGEITRRLRAEANLLRGLKHPALPALVGLGHALGGRPCLAMTYGGSQTLESLVESTGALAPVRACLMMVQICEAVGYLHRRNLRHGDIKPANVIVSPEGEPMLVDFGVCEPVQSYTDTGLIFGTPHYMAPEVIRGEAPDTAADIYSMGALLYLLLTGAEPFEGKNAVAVCEQHLYRRPLSPSRRSPHTLPSELESMVLRCLAKSTRSRPTLSELAACVARLAGCVERDVRNVA